MFYVAYLFLTLCSLDSQLKEIGGLSSLKHLLPTYNDLFRDCKGPALWLSVPYTHVSNPIRNLNEGRKVLQLGTNSEGRDLLITISAVNCWMEIHNTIHLRPLIMQI